MKAPRLSLKRDWWVNFICSALAVLLASTYAQDAAKKPTPENVVDNWRLTEAEQAIAAAGMRQMLSSVQCVIEELTRATCRRSALPPPKAAWS